MTPVDPASLTRLAYAIAVTGAPIGGVALAARVWLQRWRQRGWDHGARLVTIAVPPECSIEAARAWWGQLVGLLRPARVRWWSGQPHLVWEYLFTSDGLAVRVWVPGVIPPGLVEHAVTAAWTGATVTTRAVEHPHPVALGSTCAGGRLRLGREDHYPLRSEHGSDPLRALLGATSDLRPGERACVQVLARPVTGHRLRTARRAAAALRGGLAAPASTMRGAVFDLITPTAAPGAGVRSDPVRTAELRAVADKAARPRYAVAIRYAVASPALNPGRVRGRAHAIAGVFALYTGHNHLRRQHLRNPTRRIGDRRLARGFLLSVDELAALAHLPLDENAPGVTRAGARPTPPPACIPSSGSEVKVLGDADAGPRRPVGLATADARHHLHVLGANGAGKSTLLAHLILADAAAGRAVVLIDPKGDLTLDLLNRLPAEYADRVVLFDPADHAPPPALDLLHGADPSYAVDNLVGICRRVWADWWGPRTDDILRATCHTLVHVPTATLGDIPRILTDPRYRRRALTNVHDPVLAGFWDWYTGLSDPARAQAIAPLMNKLRALLLSAFPRQLVAGNPAHAIDPAELLQPGRITLVRLPKGILGEDTASLLGSLVLAQVWQAAAGRARTREAARTDASIVLDECHNFLTLPRGIDDILAEARAYRFSLVLAHQHLRQLPADLREGISTNARNKIFLSASPEDAHALARHVAPRLGEHDLVRLDRYQAAARLLVHSQTQPAFTFRTRPLPPPVRGRATTIRRAARQARTGQEGKAA